MAVESERNVTIGYDWAADRSWMPAFSLAASTDAQFPERTSLSPQRDAPCLPRGFPQCYSSNSVWDGRELQTQPEKYRVVLTDVQVRELETAAQYFQELNKPLDDVSVETFPLPKLSRMLSILASEVHTGHGVVVLSGLDPSSYSRETNLTMYVGISSYIGGRRGHQDEFGNMLLHLTDLGSNIAPDGERQAPYSSVSQPFHTDTGSILGLYTLGKASQGGESKLASSGKIYNEMVKTRPDLVKILTEVSWIFDNFGKEPAYTTRPLLHCEHEKIIFSFSRRQLLGSATSPRTGSIPTLNEEQVEALNVVQLLAERYSLVLNLEPGDMVFWNNLGLLHARNGFTDSAEQKRHLIRLWVHNDEHGWRVPEAIQQPWNEAFEQTPRQQLWPLEPIADREYVSTQQRSSGHG